MHQRRLLISRFQVRVLGGSLGKVYVLQVKRDGSGKPLVACRGLFTATVLQPGFSGLGLRWSSTSDSAFRRQPEAGRETPWWRLFGR